VVHSKDSLFAREMQQGARAAENQEYMRQLGALGVLATEMECAHLFVLAQVHSRSVAPLSEEPSGQGRIRAGAVLAIIGDDRPFVEPALAARAEQACMQVALRSAVELMGSSGS
jgi:uridine phosphorylase